MEKVGDVAHILGVDQGTIKTWAKKFQDYLSPMANPPKGSTRLFSQADIIVLALVKQYWEEIPDYEDICTKLNSREHYSEEYVRIAYINTSLFQDIPDEFNEDDKGVVVIGGMRKTDSDLNLDIAEAYKNSGDELIRIALAYDTAYELMYPIFFTYRHAIEVYLKILVPTKDDTHDFSRLMNAFRAKYKMEFPKWAKDRLDEFHEIDPTSDTFRYANSKTPLPNDERILNLRQLRVVVDHICTGLKNLILKSSIPPAYLS